MRHVRGFVTSLLLMLNLVLWGSLVILGGLVKALLRGEARRRMIVFTAGFAERWVAGNNRIFDLMLPTEWDIDGVGETNVRGHYFIVSNHVSWVDIFVLFRVFHEKTAFIRFFLKHELIWFPIAGQACAALEFPFMRRYTPEYLERHPEKRGRDLDTTRRACERYRDIPVAILNFAEGTRFTRTKQEEQGSPYRHLLRPRVGGISFVLASLGQHIDGFFDVTLAYPGYEITMWDFITGQVPRVIARARRIAVPPEFFDAAITEPGPERDAFKAWLEGVWREKDAVLDELLEQANVRRVSRPASRRIS
jgi:1-acyl-sn-glycerol-3-phosphate acyltransferase